MQQIEFNQMNSDGDASSKSKGGYSSKKSPRAAAGSPRADAFRKIIGK